MDVVRWGMIGCGSVAERKSGPAFYKAPGSALVAVMGRRLEAVTDYAARHGIARVYTDVEALINDPEVDAVYIATPPDSHHAYSLKVAAAGKHCCVEKPMSLNAGQSREMQQVVCRRRIAPVRFLLPPLVAALPASAAMAGSRGGSARSGT